MVGKSVVVKSALVVDDDDEMAYLITHVLNGAGMQVVRAGSGEEALGLFESREFDVVLLDFELPGITGQETCRRLREFSQTPVIMVSGRSDEIDKVMTMSLGADDYVTKPFSPRELAVRVHAVMRRYAPNKVQAPTGPVLVLSEERRELELAGNSVKVTKTEFDLFKALARVAPAPMSRKDLLRAVWDVPDSSNNHTVDVHISNLRKKLRKAGACDDCIENDRGIGFRLTARVTVDS